MGRRDKNTFEKWFSYNRHKRRRGAIEQSKTISTDFSKQKKIVITGGEKRYTHGSYDNIEKQFNILKNEFIGDSVICWTHAKLIVLIRREFEIKKHYSIFKDLWMKEEDFLLKNLNTRWLISAADTFADCSSNPIRQSMSVACSCLINTVKIQETERYIIGSEQNHDIKSRINELQNGRVALFDGTSAFAIGTDDTLRNMRWRIDRLSKLDVAGKILLEVFNRLQQNPTIYKRIKDRHNRDKTGWW